MSLHEFIGRLSRAQVSENDKKWMPKWLAEYASFSRQDSSQKLSLNEPDVLRFLRGLRDRGVPAWQRLQATRTLDWYQSLVGKQQTVDFSPIVTKLNELAQRERRSPEDASATIPGEGEPGLIDETELTSVQQLRRKMRMLHHTDGELQILFGGHRRCHVYRRHGRIESYPGTRIPQSRPQFGSHWNRPSPQQVCAVLRPGFLRRSPRQRRISPGLDAVATAPLVLLPLRAV